MRYGALMILAIGLSAAAPPADPLQGTWTIVSIERDGKTQEMAIKVVFERGTYTLPSADGFTRSREGKYQLDPSKSPESINLIPSDGPNKGKAIMGIHRLVGDRLTACYDPSGAGRPTEFSAKSGSGQVLVTYRRQGS